MRTMLYFTYSYMRTGMACTRDCLSSTSKHKARLHEAAKADCVPHDDSIHVTHARSPSHTGEPPLRVGWTDLY
jgi:hypothetical protein